MKIIQCCRNCRWWDIDSARDKAGRVRSDRVARCQWPAPPLPQAASLSRIHLGWVGPHDGKRCECFQLDDAAPWNRPKMAENEGSHE